jgi:hypothetical protein
MATNEFTKTYRAEGAIPAYSIVKFSAADYEVALAAGAADSLVGITTEVAAADQEPVDVVHDGIAYLTLGVGGATRGDCITSDAAGNGVTAVAGNRFIGIAIQSGLVGEVIEVLVIPGSVASAGIGALAAGVAAGYKIARGVHLQVAATDTIATGLATVVSVTASFIGAPTAKQAFVGATIGDQAGAPAAGSIETKTFTAAYAAAVDFTDNLSVSWIAVGT